MTGHEIAENLRGSKLRWGTGLLFNKVTKKYCVLGIKAHEGKVTSSFLADGFQCGYYSPDSSNEEAFAINRVFELNDSCQTKEQCITLFDSPEHHDTNFPVEK